jgi:hypothetical protein
MIQRNRAPYGAKGNFLFGLATPVGRPGPHADARLLPLQPRVRALAVSRNLTKAHFEKLKAQRQNSK